jgi:hypothetical protein
MPLRWTIGYGALGVAILVPSLVSPSTAQEREPSRAPRVGATVSVTGCLLDERTYAAARGLARVSDGRTLGPQLVLVLNTGAGQTSGDVPAHPVYALTGLNEAKLRAKVGTRVVLTGVVEPGEPTIPAGAGQPARPGTALPAQIGVTPGGTAHEPSDALAGAPAPWPTAAAMPAARPIALGDLPRLNVQSSRSKGGSCSMPVAAPVPAVVRPSVSQPAEAPAPRIAAATTVEVAGCVRRSTDGDGDRFVLDDVSVSVADQRASAVPGSSPSGSGSGTVPATAASPTGTAGSNASIPFTLVGSGDQLKTHVDRRVRVTGTIDNAPGGGDLVPLRSETAVRGEVPRSDVAHPSAQQLRVRTITEAGGGCS